MPELGLFPLGVVLLPSEQLPLHIFEPRYRELIDECIEREREFGLVHADDDGTREIGTTAAVVEIVRRFPDGRLNVVVEGRERFRVVRLHRGPLVRDGGGRARAGRARPGRARRDRAQPPPLPAARRAGRDRRRPTSRP